MGSGKKKIEIKKIEDKNKSFVAFSKRTRGLFKKANQFCKVVPGRRFAAVVFSPSENIYIDGDLTLVTRYSTTAAAAAQRMDQGDRPTVAEENGDKEDTLASLMAEETINVEGIDDLDELRRRRDYLDDCREKIIQRLKAMQPVEEEAKELEHANHALRDEDCPSPSHDGSGIEEKFWIPPKEIKFLIGIQRNFSSNNSQKSHTLYK